MKDTPNYVTPAEPPPLVIENHMKLNSTLSNCTLSVEEIFRNELATTKDNSAFFVIDLGAIYRRFQLWNKNLPTVHPFYAIKCNTDPQILQTLNSLGANFDCASREEIRTVLKMGVSPDRIIFANPCKQISHIKYAYENGVDFMTFDNADELHKVKEHHPNAKMVLRILADDSKSVCQFGVKFGASLSVTMSLLEIAKSIGVEVVGVSFHVGSGCFDPSVYADAIHRARIVFDQAETLGMKLRLLDLGGGYPGLDGIDGCPFVDIASEIRPALDKYFGDLEDVRFIAEPGRFFAASGFSLAVNIHARRIVRKSNDENPVYMYYVNDGVYGSFNCLMFDHAKVSPKVLSRNGEFTHGRTINDAEFSCSIWGPTCDSMDCLTRDTMLPELNVSDWLYFENMGAYTAAAASTFNGMPVPKLIYTNTEE